MKTPTRRRHRVDRSFLAGLWASFGLCAMTAIVGGSWWALSAGFALGTAGSFLIVWAMNRGEG